MRIEAEPKTHVTMFDSANRYDEFLKLNHMGSGYGARAKGKLNPDGSFTIALDRAYYLRGGIEPAQLQAIIEHERTELTSDDPDPHLSATIAEYRYIKDQFGDGGLRKYHTRLCNLMGGLNNVRNTALSTVLSE